jgi:predicted glycoside hydrolase/deacetylase ChbG (UPF0249 family)
MPAKPISIIVNADDLGISPEVNAAVFDLMDRGKVTSATLLANAPAVEDACRQLRHFPRCSFGVHLNLTELQPLSEAGRRLLDPETGALSRRIAGARATAELSAAVTAEFRAQIGKLLTLGVPVSHLDSHHHIHTQPFAFRPLKAVQREFGIRRVRVSKNIYAPPEPVTPKLMLMKIAYNTALRHYYRTATTAGFTELSTYARLVTSAIPRQPSVELMTHPGSAKYADETALIEAGWTPDPSRFRFISYLEL